MGRGSLLAFCLALLCGTVRAVSLSSLWPRRSLSVPSAAVREQTSSLSVSVQAKNDLNKEGERVGESERERDAVNEAKAAAAVESEETIPRYELENALSAARKLLQDSPEEMQRDGWQLVVRSGSLSLYKRKVLPILPQSPTEYLLTGNVQSVSPRLFLAVQLQQELRKEWDANTREMRALCSHPIAFAEDSACAGESDCERDALSLASHIDKVYFRSKWPWPMKDRDYTLDRRCEIFDEDNAIVFVSKSVELQNDSQATSVTAADDGVDLKETCFVDGHSEKKGEKRRELKASSLSSLLKKYFQRQVDKIFAHAAEEGKNEADSSSASDSPVGGTAAVIVSESPSHTLSQDGDGGESKERDGSPAVAVKSHRWPSLRNTLRRKGLRFVTIFCDDCKVPVHPKVLDMLAKHAEKTGPASAEKMLKVAAALQQKEEDSKAT